MNKVGAAAVQDASKMRKANPFGNIGRVRRFLAPAVARPFSILESIGLAAIALAVGRLLSPADPLLLHSSFPWFWFVPLVLGLRYGTLLGMLSALLILGGWRMFYPSGSAWPAMYFAGGFIQTIIVGHFGDTWGTRAIYTTALNNYLNDRLVALTDSHYLLRLSHERLEKDLLAKPTTLRDAITELRRLSIEAENGAKDNALSGAPGLLEFVGRACQIEVGAIYPMHGERIDPAAIAQIGDPFALDKNDPLVTHAIETLGVAHLKNVDGALPISQYLVCAPLQSADGALRAILVVKRMPFLSLNFDNLQLLLVLLSYYADGVGHSAIAKRIVEQVKDCPADFALDLSRLARLKQTAGVDSSLVTLVFPRDEAGDSLFEHVMRRRRSLDVMWPLRGAKYSILVNLMPATDAAGVGGYLARIEASLSAQFNINLEQARIAVHTVGLDEADAAAGLKRLLQRSGFDE